MIDGKKTFSDLTVKFKKDGKSVASITDKNAEKPVESAKLSRKFSVQSRRKATAAEKP